MDTDDPDQQAVAMKACGRLRDWTQPAESVRAFIAPLCRRLRPGLCRRLNIFLRLGGLGVEKERPLFSVAVYFPGDCFSSLSKEART